jgi:hypothetical protein
MRGKLVNDAIDARSAGRHRTGDFQQDIMAIGRDGKRFRA